MKLKKYLIAADARLIHQLKYDFHPLTFFSKKFGLSVILLSEIHDAGCAALKSHIFLAAGFWARSSMVKMQGNMLPSLPDAEADPIGVLPDEHARKT